MPGIKHGLGNSDFPRSTEIYKIFKNLHALIWKERPDGWVSNGNFTKTP